MITNGQKQARFERRNRGGPGVRLSREVSDQWGGGGGAGAAANPPATPPPETPWAPTFTDAEKAGATAGVKSDFQRAVACAIPFGKHKGRLIGDVAKWQKGREYLLWLWNKQQERPAVKPTYFDRMFKVFVERSGLGDAH